MTGPSRRLAAALVAIVVIGGAPASAGEPADPRPPAPRDDGRRTLTRFVPNLGRGVIGVFHRDNLVPFVVGGGGFAYATPNSDSFVLDSGASSMLFVGGGLRLCFKHRLTLRVESRGVVLFTADRSVAEQEVSGGLTVFF